MYISDLEVAGISDRFYHLGDSSSGTAVASVLTYYCALSMIHSQPTTSNLPRTCFLIGSGTSTHRVQIQIVIVDSVVDSRHLCYLTLLGKQKYIFTITLNTKNIQAIESDRREARPTSQIR